MSNRACWRAIRGLGHPLTVTAVILLLVNDHWLRYAEPSWLTGKLGDFAWLMFAPLLCALVLCWMVPPSHPSQERWVGILSFSLIGVWFAAAKTIDPVHSATTHILDALVGWQGGLRMDVSDLLTLPALIVGWWIWHHASGEPGGRLLGQPVIMALALMGTVATSCMEPDRGITFFCQLGDTLYAGSGSPGYYYDMQLYSTRDGFAWQLEDDYSLQDRCVQGRPQTAEPQPAWQLDAQERSFRFVKGQGIYSSLPGEAERTEIELAARQHDSYERYYEINSAFVCGGPYLFEAGPFDAFFDAQSERLYVAMGLEGILVRSAGGAWEWVTVGDYHHVRLDEPASVVQLLQSEFTWAFALMLLVPPTIGMRPSDLRCVWVLILGILWPAWTFHRFPLFEVFGDVFLFAIIVISLFLNMWFADYYLIQRRRGVAYAMVLVVAMGSALFYLLPYVLWARRTLPNFGAAESFALLLVFACVLSGRQYIHWRFPGRKKKKKHGDDFDAQDRRKRNEYLYDETAD